MAVSRREPHEGGIFFIFLYIILQTAYIGKVTACLETLQNITCTCTNNSVTCTGTSYENAFGDIVSAVSNLSSNYTHGGIESINITISEFSLNSNASFENVIAENLTLGSGLTSLPENLFHGLNESLANLNLQNNKLSSVPTNALNILGQLKELDLSNNEIKNLKSDDFRGMPLLIFLNLNRNNIQTLEDETFSELTNLQVLLLDLNNMLEIEDDAFQGLNDLQMLSIAGNDLQYLAPEPFLHLSSLETLVLNRNELTSFSNINIESSSLKKLSAQYCSLKDPIEEDHFSDLPNLIFVDLSHNNIKEVKTMALSGLHHLESLNLSNNEIKRVNKNAFSGLPSLLKLSLQNNDIEVASRSAFFSLTNLTYLNLDNNKLQALLCEYTADLHSLEEISIQNNRLKTVRAGSLMYTNELKQLRMEGNDFECDCTLSSFASFLRNHRSLPSSDINSAKCSKPSALQGQRVIDVDFDSMMCANSSLCKSPSIEGSEFSAIPTPITLSTNPTTLSETETNSYVSSAPPVIELRNATFINEKICIEWGVQANETKDYRCVLSYSHVRKTNERKSDSLHFKCPSFNGDISNYCETVLGVTDVYEICGKIEYSRVVIATSCKPIHSLLTTLEMAKTTVITDIGNFTTEGIFSTLDNNSTSMNSSDTTTPIISSTTKQPTASTSDNTIDISTNSSDTTPIISSTTKQPTISTSDLTIDTSRNSSDTTPIISSTTKQPTASTSDLTIDISTNSSDTTPIISSTTKQPTASTSDLAIDTSKKFSNATTQAISSSEYDFTLSSKTENITLKPKIKYDNPFNFTLFRVYEESPNSAFIVWAVNRNEQFSKCNLKLHLSPNTSTFEKKSFPCSNNSYLATNMEKHRTYNICLTSYHLKHRSVALCEDFSLLYGESSTSYSSSKAYVFPILLGLLIFVICIVLLIVAKSAFRKRRIEKKYSVAKEEEKVQVRKSSSSSSRDRETRVRYSYTRNEATEDI